MGVIVAIGAVIASALASAVSVVASVVATIAASVTSALTAIGSMVIGAVSAVVTTTVGALSGVLGSIGGAISNAYAVIAPSLSSIYSGIATYSQILVGGMKAFLEAIHFAAILKIHNLSMIFSKDYREMMQKIYGELSKVSEALGLGTHFLNLVLRDARNIVLDVTSLMGRSYDLGEVQWLSTMNGYLKDFATKAEQYENDPAGLLTDMAEWVDKPSIDAKAGFQRSFIQLVDGVVTIADDTAGKVVKLREDLSDAIKHLPSGISRDIFEKVDPLFQEIDDFMEYEYKPVSQQLRSAVDVLNDTTRKNTDELHNIVSQILNPGDMMSRINDLSELERIRQEGIIGEIASRSQVREVEDINATIDKGYVGLDKIFQIATEVRKAPPYHVEEYKGPITPRLVTPRPGQTWFRGDF